MARIALALLGVWGGPELGAQTAAGVTAAEVVRRIKVKAGVALPERTVDTFKAGDSAKVVQGIALTMMATLDVLQRAAERGLDFVITHEPTYYGHRDTTGILESENDPVLAAKQRLIREKGLVIWRFHDIPHLLAPDMITSGTASALGWDRYRVPGKPSLYVIPTTTVSELARTLEKKLGARSIRISGQRSAKVGSVVMTHGFPGFPANRRAMQHETVDVVIIGEDHEWETIEYVVDAISAGRVKTLIVLGHVPSEQAGMVTFAEWLRPLIPGVRVELVPARDPFR